MKHKSKIALTALTLMFAPFIVNASKGKGVEYEVNLQPLNNSGVWAEAEVKIKGDQLKIEIKATGLEAGKPHPQHIHGFADATLNSSCPGFDADVDGDGVISVGEGLPSYGPIVLPLVPFNLVDEAGNLEYEVKMKVDPESLGDLANRTIILHGLTVNGSYVPSTPIACGQLELDD